MTWGNFKEDSVSEAYKKMKAEELKGNQHKLDKNKNGKLDAEDFKKLRGEETEDASVVDEASNPHATNDRVYSTPTGTVHRAKAGAYGGYKKDKEEVKLKSPKSLDRMDKTLTKDMDEAMSKADTPTYLRKKMGDKPLTMADVKAAPKDSISHPDNLAKARGVKEEFEMLDEEQLDELDSSTLKSYAKKANKQLKTLNKVVDGNSGKLPKLVNKAISQQQHKRDVGIERANSKISDKIMMRKEELDIFSETEIDSLISEVLKASDGAGKWISDFVQSDDPRFTGDSKEQRKKRALAAYYAAHKKESVDYDSFLEEAAQGEIVKSGSKEIKHANVKDKEDDQEIMEPHSKGEQDFLDQHSVAVTDDPAAEYKSGSDKLAVAAKPTATGAGAYNADSKLSDKDKASVKESASEEDSIEESAYTEEDDSSCDTGKKASGKKTYNTFKEKMNDKKGC